MQEYLDSVAEIGGPELDFDSDNKALAVAGRIEGGTNLQERFNHADNVELRKILILDMLDGMVFDDERGAMLQLLVSQDSLGFEAFFSAPNALRPATLRDQLSDAQDRAVLDQLLLNYGVEVEGLARPADYEACGADEQESVEDAIAGAVSHLGRAVAVLREGVSDTVRDAFYLAFRVLEPDQTMIDEMSAQLELLRRHMEHLHYVCDHGEQPESRCHQSSIAAFVPHGHLASGVHVCFMADPSHANLLRQPSRAERVKLVIHEATHVFQQTEDVGYVGLLCAETAISTACSAHPGDCGTAGRPSVERLRNADSLACFVFFLAGFEVEAGSEASESGGAAGGAGRFCRPIRG